MSGKWGNGAWPCTYTSGRNPDGTTRFCKHPECKHAPPVRAAAPLLPPAHAGGLSADQEIRARALAAAVRSKPLADLAVQLRLAEEYVRWIKAGG